MELKQTNNITASTNQTQRTATSHYLLLNILLLLKYITLDTLAFECLGSGFFINSFFSKDA